MERIDRFLAHIYGLVARSSVVSEEAAAVSRIAFGSFILLFALPYGSSFAYLPEGLFFPPGYSIAAFHKTFPPEWFFLSLEVIALLAICALTLGLKSRWAAFLFSLCYLVIKSFTYSAGKIDHPIMLIVAVCCLGLTNWGCQWAILPDRRWRNTGIGPALLAICLCFGMLTAGYPKFRVWLDFDLSTSGVLSWFLAAYHNEGRSILLSPYVQHLTPLMTEVMDYTAVCFELSALVLLLAGPRYWRAWLTIACVFHLTNVMILDVNFKVHMLVYLPFLISPLMGKRNLSATSLRWLMAPVAMLAAYQLYRRFTLSTEEMMIGVNPFELPFYSVYVTITGWLLMVGIGLAAVLLTGKDVRARASSQLQNPSS